MKRNHWLIAGQTLLGAILLAAWLSVVDLDAILETLRAADLRIALLAAAIGLSSTVVRAGRWRQLLRPIADVRLREVWLISLASSLVNFVVPVRSGEFARGLFLKQRQSVPISSSLPTVAVDRSLDMLAVLTVAVLGVLTGLRLGGSLSAMLGIGIALFLAFVAFVVMAIFWQKRLMQVAERAVPHFIGESLRFRLLGILRGVLIGFTSVGRHPRRLPPMLVRSVLAALLDGSVFYLLFVSVGTPVQPIVALTGYAIFALTFIIPGAPGYVGSFEAFGSLVFAGAMGIPQAASASVVVVFHALNAVMLGLCGGLAFWALGVKPSAAIHSALGREGLSALEVADSPAGGES